MPTLAEKISFLLLFAEEAEHCEWLHSRWPNRLEGMEALREFRDLLCIPEDQQDPRPEIKAICGRAHTLIEEQWRHLEDIGRGWLLLSACLGRSGAERAMEQLPAKLSLGILFIAGHAATHPEEEE